MAEKEILTAQEFRMKHLKGKRTHLTDECIQKPKNKYNSKRAKRGEISFHSELEAKYYDHLLFLQKSGLVRLILRQVKIDLPASTYLADFVVLGNQSWEIIEVKGYPTPVGELKRKQVEEIYKVTVKVITKDDF